MPIRYRYVIIPTALYVSVVLSSCATPAINPTYQAQQAQMPQAPIGQVSHIEKIAQPTLVVNETSQVIGQSYPATNNTYPNTSQTPNTYPNGYPNSGHPNTHVNAYPSNYPSTQTYPKPTPQPNTQGSAMSFGNFYEWRDNFLGRAGTNMSGVLGNAQFNSQVVRLDKNQAEFTEMPWEYLDKRVVGSAVSLGIQKRRELLTLFNQIEANYGVPASIVTAIWGLESSYGANTGNTNLVDALSTLAFEGRRRAWAEGELTALAQLIERGDVGRQPTGSWGGGMGHTQFIPSTWSVQGVDADNDGRRSPWSRADALTSTANYLKNSGWVSGLPVYYEVKLPANFDYRHIGTRQTLDTWRQLGLGSVAGDTLAGGYLAELWLPAGIYGPVLLTTPNFEAIKQYNNSSNYVLAVATLAHRINSRQPFLTSFPRHEQGLSRMQSEQLQRILTSRGYDTGGVDGVIGSNTRKAFARWQADNGRIPDGFISQSSVRGLL